MKSLRILILAPDSNPESISTSLVGYSHAEALARLHKVTLVIRSQYENSHRNVASFFHSIESIRLPLLDRIAAWCLRRIFKYDYGSQAYTAFNYPISIAFEWRAWRCLRRRIKAGEFDVVLRLLPVTPVLPSPFSFFLRKGPVPFVIGPLNGGLPWPQGFKQADQQREWLSNLRYLYRFMPFAQTTFHHASAIIAGSSQTFSEFSTYREKVFFLPENGLTQDVCELGEVPKEVQGEQLRLIYVGRLVPYKACDMALRASASLLQAGKAQLTIVGDGPDRAALESLAKSLGVFDSVRFIGWVGHDETVKHLHASDVLLFPSIREFGGGVVFEALAVGTVPVVVDFGGPGDIVNSNVGFKVKLTNEDDVVSQLTSVLSQLSTDRLLLDGLRKAGVAYARNHLSWDAKAQATTEILCWAVGNSPKPDYRPPSYALREA
jgi:glycosyltransferase involved in cell wall biosynthesis